MADFVYCDKVVQLRFSSNRLDLKRNLYKKKWYTLKKSSSLLEQHIALDETVLAETQICKQRGYTVNVSRHNSVKERRQHNQNDKEKIPNKPVCPSLSTALK